MSEILTAKTAAEIYTEERALLVQEYNGCIDRMSKVTTEAEMYRNRQQIDATRSAIIALDKAYASSEANAAATLAGIIPGQRPFFGLHHSHYMYQTSSTMTSSWSTPYNLEYWWNILSGLSGLDTDYDGNSINENWINFEDNYWLDPNVPIGKWYPFAQSIRKPADGSYLYSYSTKNILITALIATQTVDVEWLLHVSSYSSYSGAGVFLIVRDESQTRGVRGENVIQYTSNSSQANLSGTYEMQAGQKAIVCIYSSDRIYDTSNYEFARVLRLRDVNKIFPTGVEADINTINNIKARNVGSFTGLFDVTSNSGS